MFNNKNINNKNNIKLICKDCGAEFDFSEKERQFYESKGFALPKRCKSCREEKKRRYSNNGNEENK